MYKIMDLEKMNSDYQKNYAKIKSEKMNAKHKELEKDLKLIRRQVEDLELARDRALQDGDKEAAKDLSKQLEAARATGRTKLNSLRTLENIMNQSSNAINEQMAELSKDSALQAHLNDVMGKKFSRKVTKLQKEKEELENKNRPLEMIKSAALKDFNVMYALKEIEKLTKVVKSIEAKETPSVEDLEKLKQTNSDLNKHRTTIAGYFKGTITREVIDSITSFDDLNKEIKSNSRQIKGIDKSVANYETALENIGYKVSSRDGESSDISDGSSSTTRTGLGAGTRAPAPSENLPAEQPKWYQFIKRLKNWIHGVNYTTNKSLPDVPVEIPVSDEDKKQFKDSMKYDVVKQYEEQLEKTYLKQAKAQNKAEQDNER